MRRSLLGLVIVAALGLGACNSDANVDDTAPVTADLATPSTMGAPMRVGDGLIESWSPDGLRMR